MASSAKIFRFIEGTLFLNNALGTYEYEYGSNHVRSL